MIVSLGAIEASGFSQLLAREVIVVASWTDPKAMMPTATRTEWRYAAVLAVAIVGLTPWMSGVARLSATWPTIALALLVAAGFACVDWLWIPVEFGAVAIVLTASELVLVPGLLLLPVWLLLAVRGCGAVIDDTRAGRRLSLTVMNLGIVVAETAVAVAVVQVVSGSASPVSDMASMPSGMASALALGCGAASLLSSVLITWIINPARGGTRPTPRTLLLNAVSGFSAAMFAGVALVGLAVAAVSPLLLVPLVAVGVLGVGLARRWVPAHQHLTRTERLYEFSRLLATTSATDADTLADVLDEVGRMLAAHSVELIAPIALGPDQAIRVTTGRGPLQLVDLDAPTRRRIDAASPARTISALDDTDGIVAGYDARSVIEARVGDRGLLTVVDRVGTVTGFTEDDRITVDAAASHLAIWLAREQLASGLQQQLSLREYQVCHDDLTGLVNHHGLPAATRALFEPATDGLVAALAVVDINRFKHVNDALGTAAGDELLRQIAVRLRTTLPADWVIGRLSGDEFVIAGRSVNPTSFAEQIVDAVRVTYLIAGTEMLVDGAVGVAIVEHDTAPEGGDRDPGVVGLDQVLARADQAMYEAKRAHALWRLYRPGSSANREDLSISARLERAIIGGDLVVHYQPKVVLATGAVAGVEALARWQLPDGRLLAASAFVPAAEDNGLAGPLLVTTLEQAARQGAEWHANGHPSLGVAVNMSARNLPDPGLVDTVLAILERTGFDPRFLTLELTETAAVTHLAIATDALSRLSALGIRISLDDFGTGNSPLRLLHDLPVDEVKIDCSFTTPMAHDATARKIVNRLVALGHDLGTVVVAEGVQDQIVHGLLVATGCDQAQGFHYAYPADGAATSRWLDHHLSNTGARS